MLHLHNTESNMARKHLFILLFLVLFFVAPLLFQIKYGLDVSPIGLLLKLPILLLLGLISLWLIQKRTGTQFLSSLQFKKSDWLQVISRSFLLLSILYLLKSIGNVTYGRLFSPVDAQTEVQESLQYIISKPLLAIILTGPFVWLNTLFVESSRAYFHTYLASFSNSKWLSILSALLIALVLSSMQIENAPSQGLSLFVTNLTLSAGFMLLKDLKPLVITSIIYQSVDLIAFWVYS